MSVAGLKKQFHKATQKVSEKVGGAEGTKLDEDFKEMERKVDVTSRAVMEIMTKSIEYLQPNPASRARLSMMNTMSKIRGQEKGPGYPQAEALLAEAMIKFGRELGDESNFGPALVDVGDAMRELSDVKDSLDIDVKQNFIDPLQNLHDKDLKEIQHHLKKLEGRRLDFDYKKKRQGKIPDEEIRQALEKFDESKEIAESSMFNLLEMDIEQVSQLSALVQAQLEYHKQAAEILQSATIKLEQRIRETSNQPRREYIPKPRMTLELVPGDNNQHNGGLSQATTPRPTDFDIVCKQANLIQQSFHNITNKDVKQNRTKDRSLWYTTDSLLLLRELQWISHVADLCMTLIRKTKASWALRKAISLPLPIRLMRIGMKGCFMASQAFSLSTTWRS